MLSLSTKYYQIFLAQGVGFGFAASGLFSCGIVSVGQWFHKRKALALGIVLAGSSTGIFPFEVVQCCGLLMVRRRRHPPYLPPLPHSKNWLPECYPSQCSHHRQLRSGLLLPDANEVAEQGMGLENQVSGFFIVQAKNI